MAMSLMALSNTLPHNLLLFQGVPGPFGLAGADGPQGQKVQYDDEIL